MGISGIGPGSLLLILAIVLLLFGTKRIKNLGGDLGGAVKGFKKAMSDEDAKQAEKQNNLSTSAADSVVKNNVPESEKKSLDE